MQIKYIINKDCGLENNKFNPQQTSIIKSLLNEQELDKGKILELITPTLITRQLPWLIFSYYLPTFKSIGFITVKKELNPPKLLKIPKQTSIFVKDDEGNLVVEDQTAW